MYEKREEIREQIEYDLICTSINRAQVDEFVEIMLEVAMTRSPTIKIGRDAEYPTAFVQQRFEQITSSHIEKVLDEAVFLKDGQVVLHDNVDAIREREGGSVDALFRDVFRAHNYEGGAL